MMDGAPPHVRLANDIAVQFTHRPLDEAALAVAAHMRTFWEPRMRGALLEHLACGGAGPRAGRGRGGPPGTPPPPAGRGRSSRPRGSRRPPPRRCPVPRWTATR